jgi:ubiquinol oxidase
MGQIDLKKEQQATAERPRYPYSLLARTFFRSMDMLTGEQDTLAKARLVEALAPVPYRAWESRQFTRMTRRSADPELVRQARAIAAWGQEAKNNEYQHVMVLNEKLREEGQPDPRYLRSPLPWLMIASWAVIQWMMSRVAIRRAFLLNAEFEDHSEHVYAGLVRDHPEWESQPITSAVVQAYGSFDSWSDAFRRVGLDERDHMNNSFLFAGRPEEVVKYDAMPAVHEVA